MNYPYTICYISKSRPLMSDSDIRALFDQATITNDALNITGILMHSFGNFLQVLEGERGQVIRMFTQRIMNDPRHKEIFEIFNGPSPRPVFTDYSSRFTALTTQGQLDGVRQYLGSHGSDPTTEKVARLIRPFALFGEG